MDSLSGLTYLGRREAAQGDPASGVVLSPGVAMAPRKRPAVMGSGSAVMVVTANNDIAVGYPHLNGDDSTLYFSDYFFNGGFLPQAIIGTIGLTADGLSFSGDASPTLLGNAAGPLIGAVYRRGTFVGLPAVEVTATVSETSLGGAPPGEFTLTRAGSTAAPMSVSFLLTGTARNATDYFGVPLTASIAAGFPSTTVSILPFENPERAGDASVILTLSQASHYLVGSSASATVTIIDESPPAMTFAEWAALHGVVGEGGNEDGDAYGNLIEFALGTDPNIPEAPDRIRGELLQVGAQQHLALVVTRQLNNPAVRYTVEVAAEPTGPWSSGPPHTVEVENTGNRLVVRDASAVPTQSSRFMRLQVSLP